MPRSPEDFVCLSWWRLNEVGGNGKEQLCPLGHESSKTV